MVRVSFIFLLKLTAQTRRYPYLHTLPFPGQGDHSMFPALISCYIILGFPSEASEIVLPVGSGVTVHMKLVSPALPVKPCYIVMTRQYVTELIISPGERKSFTFSCRNPEKYFVLKIEKNIGELALMRYCVSLSPCCSFIASSTRLWCWREVHSKVSAP